MKTNVYWKQALVVLSAILLTACEKVIIEAEPSEETGNLTISVNGIENYEGESSTRTLMDVSQACTRLCFALYKDGERIKSTNQKTGDSDFGTVNFSVNPGEYQLLVLGHSGERNPSTTHADKIQFLNSTASNGTGFTDTFYHLKDITVGNDAKQEEIILQRATALVRIVTTDVKPANIRKVHFRYTGGSGALDATTGYGCVKSTQAVIFDLDESTDNQTQTFDLYTFPREGYETIAIDVNIIDANGETVAERTIESVPVKRNEITRYTGKLFVGTGSVTPGPTPTPTNTPQTVSIKVETDWGATNDFTF